MPNPIGFSTGYYYQINLPLEERLKRFLEVGNAAVEIHAQDLLGGEGINDSAVELALQFQYRSIHLPAHLRYPSSEIEELMPKIYDLSEKVSPHALVIHPDIIDEPEWVARNFDDRIAIENMDINKIFGQIPDDLIELFTKIPQAKWVFDINHAYTIDPSQMLARSLFANLNYRLAHYHISGFGDGERRHISLIDSGQDAMMSMIGDSSAPVIIETVAQSETESLAEEYSYLAGKLPRE